MSGLQQSTIRNRLIQLIPKAEFRQVALHLEPCESPNKYQIAAPSVPVHYAYFLNSGIGSIGVDSLEGQHSEGGLFGREGWSPTVLAVGSECSPHDVFKQSGGDGYRIEREPLLEALEDCPELHRLLLLFTYALSIQAFLHGGLKRRALYRRATRSLAPDVPRSG